MPNKAYQAGVRKERSLLNYYRGLGWIACRSAGSHSEFDVWAFNPKLKLIHLVQLKYHKEHKGVVLEDVKRYSNCMVNTGKLLWR